MFYFFFNLLSDVNLDGASDYKLLAKPALDAWKKMPEKRLFFRGMSLWIGFRRAELPFSVEGRLYGRSKWSTLQLIKFAIDSLTSFSTVLLQIISFLGGIFLIFALGLSFYAIYVWYIGDSLSGFTTVYILQLIIGSFLMISLGIIGLYLAKIYNEVKGRPRYIICQRTDSSESSSPGN